MKRCTKCGEEKPATPEFFHRNKGKKDGLYSQCKVCKKANDKVYVRSPESLERRRAHNREYGKRPEIRERKREWKRQQIRGPRKRTQAYIDYYKSPKHLASVKAYKQSPKGRETVRAYRRRPEVRERQRVYGANRRARKNSIQGTVVSQQIQEQLKRQKCRCYYCKTKFEQRYIYHIDHTFPISRVAGTDIPANDMGYLVLACPHCNSKKKANYPHEFPEGGKLL